MNEENPPLDEPSNLGALLRNLKHPDQLMRRQAALALGQLKAQQAVEPLLELLRDHQTVMDAEDAAWALGVIGDRRAVGPLMATLDKPDVPRSAVGALVKLGDPRMVELLIRHLKHPDRFVRCQATLALGQLKAQQAVEPLLELLQNYQTDADAAQNAASALGEIGDRRAVEPLISSLDKPDVTGRAIEALAKLGDPRMVEPLIRLFKERPVSSIATILGNFGDQRAVEPLIEALHDPDPSLRFYVARALGKLRDRRALPALAWARDHDTEPILDRKSIYGKSVSYAATKAIERITTSIAG